MERKDSGSVDWPGGKSSVELNLECQGLRYVKSHEHLCHLASHMMMMILRSGDFRQNFQPQRPPLPRKGENNYHALLCRKHEMQNDSCLNLVCNYVSMSSSAYSSPIGA